MLRSMYSGISGMRVNQTKLDVTGNNIANVGTTSFKGQRVRFQDMLSQNAGRALGPSLNLGGVNAKQVGLGVQLAGIDTMTSQGMMQPTGRNLDMALDGEGYFMVARGPATGSVTLNSNTNTIATINDGMDVMYTRDGSFNLDSNGNLLTSDGFRVMGYQFTSTAVSGSGVSPYLAAATDVTTKANALKGAVAAYNTAVGAAKDVAKDAAIKAYNEYTTAKGVLNADATAIDTKLGELIALEAATTKDNTAIEAKRKEINALLGATPEIASDANFIANVKNKIVSPSITFAGDASAKITTSDGIAKTDLATYTTIEDAAKASASTPTNTNLMAFQDANGKLTANAGLVALKIPEKILDGGKEVRIISFSVEKTGLIKAVCQGGKVTVVGQLATASFNNPAGLEKSGGNILRNSPNSGDAVLRTPVGTDKDKDNSGGYGDVMQGALEMSNVDLAEQFTDMITATRAFQAAGKMINTGDEILQDIINLKR